MMRKRTDKDIWQGLYDFLLVERRRTAKLDPILEEIPALNKQLNKAKVEITKVYRHVLSHQTIDARFIIAPVESLPVFGEPDEFKFYSRKKIADLPKPVLISRFLDDFPA